MTADTNTLHYWLNWRALVCGFWMLSLMIAASVLIWKYEGSDDERRTSTETQQKRTVTLYADLSWRPSLKAIHPAWLLAFRILSFSLLLTLFIINVVHDGAVIFYFYTQWTYTLVTIYFGLGSALSIYGCYQFYNKFGGDLVKQTKTDEEQGTDVAPTCEENTKFRWSAKRPSQHEEHDKDKIAGIFGYAFQIIYQTSAGATVLTDVVFWLIICPFLTDKYFRLNFSMVGIHSANAIFLLGDTALNSLKFPWFHISYFVLWTTIYVIFQWAVHACVSVSWPYSFLDLSSSYAPIWYFAVALLLVPCYALFPLILKLKCYLLLRWFPQLSWILQETSSAGQSCAELSSTPQ